MNAMTSAVAGKPAWWSRVSPHPFEFRATGTNMERTESSVLRSSRLLFEEQSKTSWSDLTLKEGAPYYVIPRQILAGRASAQFFDEIECIASPVDSGRV